MLAVHGLELDVGVLGFRRILLAVLLDVLQLFLRTLLELVDLLFVVGFGFRCEVLILHQLVVLFLLHE